MNRYASTPQGMPVIDAAPSQMAKVIALRERRRPASPDTRTARRNRRKAAWIWLYALLPLSLPLFALADVVPATSPWRYCTESLAVLVLIGGAGLWVRLNRRALMDATLDRDEGHADLPPTT